jgi:hypothetical protein
MAPGHVFVTQGDLTRLHCDAWLLPTAADLWAPQESWFEYRKDLAGVRDPDRKVLDLETPADWGAAGVRTFPFAASTAGMPRPWPTITGAHGLTAGWIAVGVREFLDTAFADVTRRGPVAGSGGVGGVGGSASLTRTLPLLGVPFVGTGTGGAHLRKAEVAEALLDVAYEFVAHAACDVVIVAFEPVAFAALQRARSGPQRSARAFPSLDEAARNDADRLAAHARRGDLVAFVGAGLGQAAGLPSWGRLLEDLAAHIDIDDVVRTELAQLDFTDQAQVLKMLEPEKELGVLIKDMFEPFERYSLAHSLVTRLPVQHFVTTNYDQLLEWSAADQGEPLRVLGKDTDLELRRWLFKLHGCVTEPDEIVLSRQDYLRYEHRRGALEGIVQALLITQHMLFVGFSLTDPNFHRIIDEVRRLLPARPDTARTGGETKNGPKAGSRKAGTAVLLQDKVLTRRLWEDDLEIVVPTASDLVGADAPDGRAVEIFLDYLLHQAWDHRRFILDAAYEEMLTDDETRLRAALHALRSALPAVAKDDGDALTAPVRQLLEEYGLPPKVDPPT